MIECDFCGKNFNPESSRWLCPHCRQKSHCCEGSPLPPVPVEPILVSDLIRKASR